MLIGAIASAERNAAVLVSAEGSVLTGVEGDPGMDRLAALVETLRSEADAPGAGVVLEDLPAAELRRLPVSFRVATELEALTWGEVSFGAGRRHRDMAVVHAGREVEVGLVLGGRVMPRAGRLGHTSVDRTGRWTCRCGRSGCLQALLDASRQGLAPPAAALPATLPAAPTVAHSYLALGLVHLVNVINPAAIVLAGPLIEAVPEAFAWLAHVTRAAALAPSRAGLRDITAPHAGSLSTLVGAAAFARRPHG